jgi:hypothetical protein
MRSRSAPVGSIRFTAWPIPADQDRDIRLLALSTPIASPHTPSRSRARGTLRLVLSLLVVAIAAAPATSAAGVHIFKGDFETAGWGPWNDLQYEEERPVADSFVRVTDPVRQGHFAAKITVRQGYSRWGYNEDSELVWKSGEHEGDNYYYAWSTLFPKTWTAPYGWGIFAQWHADPGNAPAIAFDARGNDAYLELNGGLTDEAWTSFEHRRVIPLLSTLSKGRWNDFVLHVRWSAFDRGSVEVWHRLAGERRFRRAVALSRIPTLQRQRSGTTGIFALWGLYRASYCSQPTLLDCASDRGVQVPSVLYEDGFVRSKSFRAVVGAAFGDRTAAGDPRPARAPRDVESRTVTSLPLHDAGSATDPGCGACSVTGGPARIDAAIAGGRDDRDTAVRILRIARPGGVLGRTVVRDTLLLHRNGALENNVAVLQLRDVRDQLIWELYLAQDRTLRLWSPPGGLRSRLINLTTGFTVPTDGKGLRLEVSSVPRGALVVRVGGVPRILVRRLSGASTGAALTLRAGIDHYDGESADDPVRVVHQGLTVAKTG